MKQYIKKSVMLGIFVMFTLTMIIPFNSALEDNVYCVNSEITDINPSSVDLESEVTVAIQFDNCGTKLPEVFRFEIKRFSDDINIREPLIIEFDEPFGYSNSQRFNIYHLYVTGDATPGEYVFEYEISYGGEYEISKEGNFSITVTSEMSELNVAYVKTEPIIPKIGEETTLTIRLENFGDGNANSVKANIDIPFFGIKDAFLGELESGDDSSAVFTIIPDKSGSIDYNLVVIYKDDFGEHTFNEKLKLNVQEDRNKNNILTIVGIVLLLLLIGYLIYSKSKKSNKLNMGK